MHSSNSTDRLYRQHHDAILRLATKLTRSRADAQDVVQDVFVIVERRKSMLGQLENPSCWLRRITSNVVRHRWRDQSKQASRARAVQNEFVADVPSPLDVLEWQRARELFARAFASLPPQQRELVVADETSTKAADVPTDDGAAVKAETLRVRRFRARSLMARRIRELEVAGPTRSGGRPHPSRVSLGDGGGTRQEV